MACSIYSFFGPEGVTDWDKFIKRGHHDPRKAMQKWRKVAKKDGYSYTVKNIFKHAYHSDPTWYQRYKERYGVEPIDADFTVLKVIGDETTGDTQTPNTDAPEPPEQPDTPKPPDPTMFEVHWHGEKSDRPSASGWSGT